MSNLHKRKLDRILPTVLVLADGTEKAILENRINKHERKALMPAGTVRYHSGRWYRGTESEPL